MSLKLDNCKRAFLISDTHFGVRTNSQEWLEIQRQYFYDFFIPTVKKHKKPGDVLIHCGDVFDSRHSVNLFVIDFAINLFEELSKIFPEGIYIILGNHDIARKNTNEVHSVKILKWIPNVHIFEEPEILEMGGKKALMMPWRASVEDEASCIESFPADFLFCHTDVKGLKFNKHTAVEAGIGLDMLNTKFRKVFSGHIHFAQKNGNFRMLGCPYQMTRSDMGNEKGIWVFDFESEEETYYVNDFSPKFIKILFEKVLDMEMQEFLDLIKGNFVDVLVDPKWSLNFPFSQFTEELSGYRRLDFVPRIASEMDEDGNLIEVESADKIDILSMAEKLIMSTSHEDGVKTRLVETVRNLYDRVLKEEATESENEQ